MGPAPIDHHRCGHFECVPVLIAIALSLVACRGGEAVVDAPGECFWVHTINTPRSEGMMWTGDRWAPAPLDLGVVTPGVEVTGGVAWYPECTDRGWQVEDIRVIGVEGDPFAFRVTSTPALGDGPTPTGSNGASIDVAFASSERGMHRATLRLQLTHGYYDTDVLVEVLGPDDPPRPLPMPCAELSTTEISPGFEYDWVFVSQTCAAGPGRHFVIYGATTDPDMPYETSGSPGLPAVEFTRVDAFIRYSGIPGPGGTLSIFTNDSVGRYDVRMLPVP